MLAVRSIFRWIPGFLVFGLGAPLLVVITFLPPEIMRFKAATLFCRAIVWSLGGHIQVEGKFPTDRNYIFMANHGSMLDVFILVAALRGKFTAIIAHESLRYFLFGTLVKRYRVIPIKRKNLESALESIKIAEQRFADHYNVVILPEGTRTLTGELGPLKKGGFHMAINTKAPINVIRINGAFEMKPKTSWHLRPRPINVHFGKVIEPDRYDELGIEGVMDEVRSEFVRLAE
ncbi:lysophospholipid acyltransferase family protein [Candidatus Neomarinimicrobiota bacterium]